DEPNIVAIEINDRDKSWHDIYRIDVRTGARELLFENRQELSRIVLDRQLHPRLASRTRTPEGGRTRYRIDGSKLEPIGVVEHEDDLTTYTIGFTRDGKTLYGISSVGRDTAALLATDWATGKERVLAEHPKADIGRIIVHPQTFAIEAAGAQHLTLDWIPLEERMADDLKRLHGLLPGEVSIADRTHDDSRWIVVASAAEAPATYHLYERGTGKIAELFATRPDLAPYRLAPMRGHIVGARRLRLRSQPPVAVEPWLCRVVGELPRLDRLRQEFRQCRRSAVGPQDARRSARRRRLGREGGYRRQEARCYHGRLLRRLRDAGGPCLHARGVLLRCRHRRPVQSRDPAGDHSALLGGVLREPRSARRRPAHRGRAQAVAGALAAQLRRRHRQAAADRPGRQRSARQASRVRPDHCRHARQGPARH